MLITNFASGELSGTLFGRTDLPQYYQGASRLENFDVIPTGGISRRNGTKRLLEMRDDEGNPLEGRIIPFILDREHSFLLVLTPEVRDGEEVRTPARASLYRDGTRIGFAENTFAMADARILLGGTGYTEGDLLSPGTGDARFKVMEVGEEGEVLSLAVTDAGSYRTDVSGTYTLQGGSGAGASADVTSVETVPLYKRLDQIREIQYAQNFDAMILAHEDYPPLEIRLAEEEDGTGAVSRSFRCGVFDITFSPKVTAPEGVDVKDFERLDPVYADSGFLYTEGNYPRAVTFLNSRIFFAGTRKNPQRIFASKVNDCHDFSTYKTFVTQTREYITVEAEITVPDGYITVLKTEDLMKFSKPIQDYYLESNYYEEGAAIADITGDKITLTKPLRTVLIDDDTLREFTDWKEDVEKKDGWSDSYNIYYAEYFNVIQWFYLQYGIGSKTGQFKLWIITHISGSFAQNYYDPVSIEIDHAQDCVTDSAKLYEYVKSRMKLPVFVFSEGYASFIAAFFDYIKVKENNRDNVMAYTIYSSGGAVRVYYGSPVQILQQLNGTVSVETDITAYLAFYTKTEEADEYPTPDDGFTFEIASDMSDAIRWIGQNKNLLAGTETAEWVIPAGVNATNVQAVLNSRYGSDKIQGTAVGDAFCFFQSGRKALVEYYIPQQDNNFRANNMAMLSPDMLHESPAFDFDFISAPYTKIFVSREDGVVASLLYERGTGTFAWGRVITSGVIKSVATLPGKSGYDEVYLIVERDGRFFLERLDERGKVYLDSNEPWEGTAEQRAAYGAGAVLYDETKDRIYPLDGEAVQPMPGDFSPSHTMHIGYPFTSRVRSMPVLANDRMKQNNIKALKARFRDSFMPRVRSEPNRVENTIPHRGELGEGFTGVVNIPFPGVYERDVFFEFIFSEPRRCEILAVNAEVN